MNDVKKDKLSNVMILMQEGIIPNKMPDKHFIGLEKALSGSKGKGAQIAAQIGSVVLTLFAANQLGLMPPPKDYSPGQAYAGLKVAEAAANHAAIAFELPKMEDKNVSLKSEIRVLSSDGKTFLKRAVPVINPLGDIAHQAIEEDSTARYLRTGIRVAMKHVVAIAASYATYKAIEGKSGKFFAKSAALLQYVGASRAIEAGEKADTRYWSTLPFSFRATQFFLPKGEYTLQTVLIDSAGAEKIVDQKPLSISSETEKKMLNQFI